MVRDKLSYGTKTEDQIGEDASKKLFAIHSKLAEAQTLSDRANESLSTTNETLARTNIRLVQTNARLQNLSNFESGSIWMKLRLVTFGFIFSLLCLELLSGTAVLLLSAQRDYQHHRRIQRLEETTGLIDREPSVEERID